MRNNRCNIARRRPKKIETFLIGRPWNNLLIVQITTDDGLTGLGEGTMQWQGEDGRNSNALAF